MILKKTVAVLTAVSVMTAGLTGCGRESLEDVNLRILEEKYGKEFVIKECFGPKDCIAYPADDPELIFYSGYTVSGGGYDLFQNEIVARRYKRLAEEKLDELGFKYKYYLDVDASFFNEETQKGELLDFMLIGNDSDLDNVPSKYSYYLNYDLFISYEAFEMTDIEIFDLASKLFDINITSEYGDIGLYFVTDKEYKMTLDHYSNYTEIEPWGVTDFYHKLKDDYWNNNDDSKFERGLSGARANYIFHNQVYNSDIDDYVDRITTFEEFEKKMQEIRSNGLYK